MQIHELTKKSITEADTTGVGGATDGAFGATGFQSGGLLDRLKRTAAAVKQSGGVKAAAKSLSNKVQVPGAPPDKKRSAWTSTAALTQSPFMQAYRGGVGSVQSQQLQPATPAQQTQAAPAPQPTIMIGGQRIDPNDPKNANIVAAYQQQQGQPVPQTAGLPQSAQPPRGAGMPPGAGFQTDLGLKGLTRQKAEDVGEYLQRVSGNNTVKNTGNAHVNAMLELMGFEIR
jgi:hypothetical protein